MKTETKILLGVIGGLTLIAGIRYAQRSYAISYVKKNWDKINLSQSSPEPKDIPMFGFRSWGWNPKTESNIDKINLTKTFPFANVAIYKDENGNFIVD